MPIADRLVHALAIVTPAEDAADDDYGQPVPGEPTVTLIAGLIQPKATNEMLQPNQAGSIVADHTIYVLPRAVSGAAYVRFEPDDGDRYQIVGIRYFSYGRDPHIALDCRRVVSALAEAAAS